MPDCGLRSPARRPVTRRALSLAAGVLALWQAAQAGGLPAEESAKIDALIAAVERLTDAAFIRNGRAYPSAAAAEFLRRKYRLKSSTVASAEDFIERVASFSTNTGRPYRIRLGDGREMESAHFLRTELERLRLQKP